MTEIELRSAKEIDYTKLRDLLKQQNWKEADRETANVMLRVANRTNARWLRVEDIDNFPCEDLRTIDQLWVGYSNGRFGFSVQAKIYRELDGTRKHDREFWISFGNKVGWSWETEAYFTMRYRSYSYDYHLTAPQGNLPFFYQQYGGDMCSRDFLCMECGDGWLAFDGSWWSNYEIRQIQDYIGQRGWGQFVSIASRLVKCNL